MAFLGISTAVPVANLPGAVGAIVDSIVGDLIDTITGETKYKRLFDQDESDIKQYSTEVADRRKWHTIPDDRTVPEYFFLLKYKGTVIQVPFNINPQRETIQEPHSTTVTYTQGGGKVIQSEGCINKDITIIGSCGLYPGERRQRLPDSGLGSGFEGFKFLQNVFRKYCFLTRFGDLGAGLQLIYINRRSQESWVVHPKVFTAEDATEHNFNRQYTIQLETLYPYEGDDAKGLVERLLDSIPGWRQADAIVQRFSEVVDQVNASAGQISAIIDSFGTVIFSRVASLANSYADLVAGRLPNLANFKRDSIKNTAFQLRQTVAALEAAGADSLARKVARLERAVIHLLLVDEAFDSSPTKKAESITQFQNNQAAQFTDDRGTAVDPQDAIDSGAVTGRPSSGQLLGGSQNAPNALPGTETYQAQNASLQPTSTFTQASVGGSALDPNGKFQMVRFQSGDLDPNLLVPPTTRQIESQLDWSRSWDEALFNIDPANADYRTGRINNGDSIQTLAFRLLGDHARWIELMLLNNLVYPYVAAQSYIDANNLTNVLPWTGTILYPVPKRQAVQRLRVWRNETFESLALTPFERSLGNDILIDEKTGDAVWTANDLALVYGVNNIKQFMRKRVLIRKGQLRRSLRFGFSNFIGTTSEVSEGLIKAEARALFFDDERISSSEALSLNKQGGFLALSLSVNVKDNQDPIIITEQVDI